MTAHVADRKTITGVGRVRGNARPLRDGHPGIARLRDKELDTTQWFTDIVEVCEELGDTETLCEWFEMALEEDSTTHDDFIRSVHSLITDDYRLIYANGYIFKNMADSQGLPVWLYFVINYGGFQLMKQAGYDTWTSLITMLIFSAVLGFTVIYRNQ